MRLLRQLFGHKEVALVLLIGLLAFGFVWHPLLLLAAFFGIAYVATAEPPKER